MSVQQALFEQVKELKNKSPEAYAEFITTLTAWRLDQYKSHVSILSQQEEVTAKSE